MVPVHKHHTHFLPGQPSLGELTTGGTLLSQGRRHNTSIVLRHDDLDISVTLAIDICILTPKTVDI